MPIMVSDSSRDFTPAPEGVHQAVCCDVIDLGDVETEWNGTKKVQHKIRLIWQIDAINADNNLRFCVFGRYTASLHENARLCKDLESWRGRRFTDEEKKGFDVERLIGVNCLLQVIHRTTEKGTYANVQSIMPLHRGMEAMTVMGYVRDKDRPADEVQPAENDFVPPYPDDDIPF